ncbi:MAG TPA: hypothetical protein PLI65_06370 [Bacteroidales bacterium]|nr:hypothetical protein [Bacteroidales bacterium]
MKRHSGCGTTYRNCGRSECLSPANIHQKTPISTKTTKFNPKPETLNPKPETQNPKHETRNPKPETRNNHGNFNRNPVHPPHQAAGSSRKKLH